MKKSLSKTLRNFYGIGDFLNDMGLSFKTYYWTIFLTNVAMLPLPVIAIINSVVSTFEIFASPFYGMIIDVVKPMKWGRYRSFLLILPPITGLLFAAQWFVAGTLSPTSVAIVLIILGIIYSLAFNTQFTANLAIIPLVSSNEEERGHLSSRRWAWINLAKVILGYVVTFFLAIFAFGNPGGINAYAFTALAFAVIGVFGYWAHFKMSKGYEEESGSGSVEKPKTEPLKFKVLIDSLIKNPYLLAIFVASTFTAISSFTIAMMGNYQFNMVLGAPEMFASYLAITNLGAVVGSLLAGVCCKKFDTKKLSMIALPCIVGGLIVARLFSNSIWGFTLSMLVVQFLASFNYPLFVTLYSNCAVYSEWKTGKKANALIMGISNVPVKIAILIVGIMIPAILGAAGFVAGGPITETVSSGIANGITIVPMVCYAMAFLTITFCFKLSRKRLNELQEEIDAKNIGE